MKNKIKSVFLIIHMDDTYGRQEVRGCFGLKEDAERYINAIEYGYRGLYHIKQIEVAYY